MAIIDTKKLIWRATAHGTPCLYKEDIENAVLTSYDKFCQWEIDPTVAKNSQVNQHLLVQFAASMKVSLTGISALCAVRPQSIISKIYLTKLVFYYII